MGNLDDLMGLVGWGEQVVAVMVVWVGEVGGQLAARTERLLRGKRCTLMCLDRWSLRANFFSHTGHW